MTRFSVPIQYLVYREGLSAVFPSQVLTPVSKLRVLGYDVRLGVFTPIGQWLRGGPRRRLRDLQAAVSSVNGLPVSWFPSPPSRARWTASDKLVLAAWLAARFGRRGRFLMHCRGSRMTRIALAVKPLFPKAKIVYDCRGVEHAELAYHGLPEHKAVRLRESEADAARRADRVLCVSEAMARYVGGAYGLPRARITVVPCCVDAGRFARAAAVRADVRRRLSLEGRLVIAYCGSVKAWQLPEECLGLFRRIRRSEPDAHFLAVTTQAESFRRLAHQNGVGDDALTVVRAAHEEVPDYLAAADVGLLLRERLLVNQVAAPVKFAEYLATGNPVIISEGIGDYSDLTAREGTGVVVPRLPVEGATFDEILSFLKTYRQAPDRFRARCREAAARHLDSEAHLGKVAALYDRVSNNGAG